MDFKARSFLNEIGLDKCVFCHSNVLQGKVLSCLHLACKSCALSNVSFGNKITCTRCQHLAENLGQGYNVIESLADWTGYEATSWGPNSSDSEGLVSLCDDEACRETKTRASSRCDECAILLCEGHTFLHSRSRSTRAHKLSPMNEDGEDSKCRLHTTQDVIKFCSTCTSLVCEKCLAKDAHTSHDVRDLQVEADRFRSEFDDELATLAGNGEEGDLLSKQQSAVEAEIGKIAEQHALLSVQISDDFKESRRKLLDREIQLKGELDQVHWKVSKRLERFKSRTSELRGRLIMSRHLAGSLSDIGLLRASQGIKCAIQQSVSRKDEPDADGSLDATYHGFSSVAHRLGSLTAAGDGTGSDRDKNTITCLQFDAMKQQDGINLSSSNQTATTTVMPVENSLGSGQTFTTRLTVCVAGDYSMGVVKLRLKLLKNACNHYVGVDTGDSPMSFKAGFLGWGGHQGLCKNTDGGRLCLPWRDGDVLCLTLDCTGHRLTALHERSGKTEHIPVPAVPLCFKVRLCPEGAVTILPRVSFE